MASRPDGLDRRRFQQLASLLDSPHVGERHSALDRINELLGGSGLTWRQVLPDLDDELLRDDASTTPAHVAQAAELVRRGRGILSRFETEFLVGIGGYRKLSLKQCATLAEIVAKVQLAEAAGRAAA